MMPTPFTVSFPSSEIDRMINKIKNTRLPSDPIVPNASWDYGIDLGWLNHLKATWENEWSWDEALESINKYCHFKVDIEDLSLHFVHVRSPRSDAIPLILSHGWPSTFLEFWHVVDDLVNPSDASKPAFHVVIPSMPGYIFSSGPQKKGWNAADTARVYNSLMVDVLNYKTYAAAAGDWGSLITIQLINNYPDSALTAHFTMIFAAPPMTNPVQSIPALFGSLPWVSKDTVRWLQSFVYTETEIKGLDRLESFTKHGAGYQKIQGTKPMTLGAGLYDNPVGILAWIGEKYHEWSDPQAPAAPSMVTPNHIITQTALYYLTYSIHTSFLPYKEYGGKNGQLYRVTTKKVPIGVSRFPAEILLSPVSWLKNAWNLTYYKEHCRGGHFAAVDNPPAYVADVRATVSKNYHSRL